MNTNRSATAQWVGSGTEGGGYLSTPSAALTNVRYSYFTRFADGAGTNPEELIAAAHASCFSMKLAFNLQAAGLTAVHIHTNCYLSLKDGIITGSHLRIEAIIPGLLPDVFEALVQDAKENCPISKLLAIPIIAEARLLLSGPEVVANPAQNQ